MLVRAGFWIVVVLAVAFTSDARANDTPAPRRDPAAAQSLFEQGRALVREGRAREACEKFDASQALDPAVGTLFNTATCALDRGALATAWLRYREAVELARRLDDARESIAAERASELEARVPRLRVRVDARAPPGLRVTKDGVEFAAGAFDTPIPVDPGEVHVEASAPGHVRWSTRVSVSEGRLAIVDVPGLVPLPTLSAREASPPAWRKPAGLAGLGVGAIALGVATVFGARAWSTWSDVERTCPSGECADESTRAAVRPEHERASSDAALATGLAIGGAVLATVGLVALLTTPRAK